MKFSLLTYMELPFTLEYNDKARQLMDDVERWIVQWDSPVVIGLEGVNVFAVFLNALLFDACERFGIEKVENLISFDGGRFGLIASCRNHVFNYLTDEAYREVIDELAERIASE